MYRNTENGYICLTAENGKRMYNGEIYAIKVYLKNEAGVANWNEVDEAMEPQEEEEISDSEALSIILGGEGV